MVDRADVVPYLYPWDVIGDGNLGVRLKGMGVARVCLAAAYHSVRAGTPNHPEHRIVSRPSSLYVDVPDQVWGPTGLRPDSVEPTFAEAAVLLEDAGLIVEPWIVLSHHDTLAARRPDLAVRNAFDDVYDYALCPSSPVVRDYQTAVVAGIVAATAPAVVVIEALGPLGAMHQSAHEKTPGWNRTDAELLSLCFCDRCRQAMGERGLDGEVIAQCVRRSIGTRQGLDQALGPWRDPVFAVRHDAVEQVAAAVGSVLARTGARARAFVDPDPWVTGPASLTTRSLRGMRPILHAWDALPTAEARMRLLTADRGPASAYITLLNDESEAQLGRRVGALVAAGADSIDLYHAGLAPTARLEIFMDLVEAAA